MSKDRVSVVITAYNYESFVAESIESVLKQSYRNLEVIVVNDGSTDNTAQVIQKYKCKITYIEQPNSGVVIARNNGARQASGEYILFLDADDYLPSKFIETAIQCFRHCRLVGFVYTDRQVVGADEFYYRSNEFDRYLLLITNFVGLSSLIKREAFEAVGGFRHGMNKAKSYEDWDLWLNICKAGYWGQYCSETFYFHRKLYQGSRNDASTMKKLSLRVPIIKYHKSEFLKPASLVRMPSRLIRAAHNKQRFLRARRSGN